MKLKFYNMKKIILSLSLLLMACVSNAQSEAYINGMKGMIAKVNAATSDAAYQDAANGFKRIAEVDQQQWLPNYYAAYSMILQALTTSDKTKIDGILDQADRILSGINNTGADDEVWVLKAFSKSTRIGVDPMSRGMKFGAESSKFLQQAKSINDRNPRIYFLEGQSAFYTPEQFGGGKKIAQPLYQKAVELYENSTPSNELMPNWGKEITVKMLSACAQ